MIIRTLTVGPIAENCYIVSDDDLNCVVIDPGDEGSRIIDYIEEFNLKCGAVLLTHGHPDHIGALYDVLEETGAALYMHEADNGVNIGSSWDTGFTAPEGTHFYKDGDQVVVGSLTFQVLGTPGHTPGSVCLKCEDALFTGDTLFRDSCGRTDFALSDPQAMTKSLSRLCHLPENLDIYPGHMGASTLDRERRCNYFLIMACNSEI